MPTENESIDDETQARPFSKTIAIEIHDRIHYRAFVLGVLAILSLLSIGMYLQPSQSQSILNKYYTPVFSTVFIGLATGHHIGLAFTSESDNLNSAYIGAFTTLTLLSLFITKISPLSFALVGIATVIFLAHDVNIVENHDRIEMAIDVFAGRVARFGVLAIALLEYVVPFVNSWDIVSYIGMDAGTVIVVLAVATVLALLDSLRYRDKAKRYERKLTKASQKIENMGA